MHIRVHGMYSKMCSLLLTDPSELSMGSAGKATSYEVVSFSVYAGMVDDGIVCLQGECIAILQLND